MSRHLTRIIHRTSKRTARRAATLVELSIAAGLFVLIAGVVMSLFLTMLQEERSNTSRLNMTHEVSGLHRQLREIAANGANIAVANGELNNDVVLFRRLDDNSETPVFAELRYIDEDDDNDTIEDNFIVFLPDREDEENQQTLVRLVSRIPDAGSVGGFLPVFTRSPGFGAPLVVQFRVGDRSAARTARGERAANEEDRRDDAHTGMGYQGIIFQSAYGPRNG
jgi:hypothetical protein